MNDKSIGVLILAAGGSSRMGRPKQLLQLDGKSLVRRAAQTAIEAGGQPVGIVTGADTDAVAAEMRGLPVHVAMNPIWEKGMGFSIQTGMKRLLEIEPRLNAMIIMLCDQPGISVATLRRLMDAHTEGGKPLCAAAFGDAIAPPALFSRQFFDELLSIPPHHGAKQILLKHSADLLRVDCPEAALDVDTPADYDAICFQDRPLSPKTVSDPR